MKRGIFYLTFNGIFNNTNGIGTQTKTLLQGIENDYIKLSEEFGDFELNIVAPIFKVIPAAILADHDYFTDKDIKYDLKLKNAEFEKFIANNNLIFHELKDGRGVTYTRVFLKDENIEFVKGRGLRRFSPPQFIDDGKGGHYRL